MSQNHLSKRSYIFAIAYKLNYLAFVITIFAAIFSYQSYTSLLELQQASQSRYDSFLLSEQLRLSSDQLTFMARAYAASGNPKYQAFFNRILAIRNGTEARPLNYHRAYWDMLLPESGIAPFANGAKKSLQALLIDAGFTEQELFQLQQAHQQSDKLIKLEETSFSAIKQAVKEPEDYHQSPYKQMALSLLYSEEYLQEKSTIMAHVNEFYRLQEDRTSTQVEQMASEHKLMTILAVLSFALLIAILMINFRLRNAITKQFIAELKQEVNSQTHQISQQNHELSATLNDMEMAKTQLVESEKMASLGSLVAGVAHEINTPVGVGVTASTSLQEEVAHLRNDVAANNLTKNLLNDYLNIFEQTASLLFQNLSRVAALVKSFKQVAVDQAHDEIREIELNLNVHDVIDSIKPKYKYYQAQITVDIDDTVVCKTYPGALTQIVTNLLVNAFIHAFEPESNGTIHIQAKRNNELILLTITDDGKGMSAESCQKIFEPFYTTKRNAGGTGLGMHIVFNLITQKLLGNITCKSEPKYGTEFTITFPAIHK